MLTDALAVQMKRRLEEVTIVEGTEVIVEAIEAIVDCIDRMSGCSYDFSSFLPVLLMDDLSLSGVVLSQSGLRQQRRLPCVQLENV